MFRHKFSKISLKMERNETGMQLHLLILSLFLNTGITFESSSLSGQRPVVKERFNITERLKEMGLFGSCDSSSGMLLVPRDFSFLSGCITVDFLLEVHGEITRNKVYI